MSNYADSRIRFESFPPIFFWRNNKPHLSYIKGISQIQINCNKRAGSNVEQMDASETKVKAWYPHLVLPQSPALDGYSLRSQLLTPVPKGSIKKASCQVSSFLDGSLIVFGTWQLLLSPAWLKPSALLGFMDSMLFLTDWSIVTLRCSSHSFHVFAVHLLVLILRVYLKDKRH